MALIIELDEPTRWLTAARIYACNYNILRGIMRESYAPLCSVKVVLVAF